VIYRIIYSDAARADLREIAHYFRTVASDIVAEAVSGRIITAIESLAIRPTRHRFRNYLGPRLRARSVGNYLVFYHVGGETVEIVRILHGSRNITAKDFLRDGD
jgi:toxin ParE1/3/4